MPVQSPPPTMEREDVTQPKREGPQIRVLGALTCALLLEQLHRRAAQMLIHRASQPLSLPASQTPHSPRR